MKKILISILFSIFAVSSSAVKFSTCAWYDGYWGNWESIEFNIRGNYSGMILYDPDYHPSYYSFKFTINNFIPPTKDEKKRHIKSDEWYQYEGVVEYYVTDAYPTIKDVFKKFPFPSVCPALHKVEEGQTPCAKRTVKATIRIAPYKDHPKVYNIMFEDVRLGIDLEGNTF